MSGDFQSGLQDRQFDYRFHGFDFASRQPGIRVFVKVDPGSLRDTATIDKWLSGPFAIEDEPPAIAATGGRAGEADRRTGLVRALLERALILYGDLMRGSQMPCFERGQVLTIRATAYRPQNREAIVLLPIVDHLPAATFGKLYVALVKLISTDLASEPTPEAAAEILERIDRTVVKPFAAISPIGLTAMGLCRLAFDADIPFRHIGGGLIKLGTGSRGVITRGSSVLADGAIGAQVSHDKQVAADLLRAAGFPAPDHIVVETGEMALAAAHKLGWPVVVKPSNKDRSEGVTIGIADDESLSAAFERANRESRLVLVERQVPGICHRILIANRQLMYAAKRHPKGLVGNGVNTVTQLVADANAALLLKPRWKRMKEVPLDEEAITCLATQGLSPETVPEEGRQVFVRSISSDRWGGSIETLTDSIHPDNVELAINIADLLGLKVAGIDLITPDVSRPWHENGGIVTEVNFQPQFAIIGREADLARMIPAIIDGDGRIPVHLVIGGDAGLAFASKLRDEFSLTGRRVFLTAAALTLDAGGREAHLPFSTLLERALALSLRQDVDELVLVAMQSDVMEQGLAVDRLASVHLLDPDPVKREKTRAELAKRFVVGRFLDAGAADRA